MTSFMSVGWGPSRQVTRQAGGLQPRTSEDVQGVGWAAAEASPAESPGEPHEAGGNADPPSRTRVEVPGVFFFSVGCVHGQQDRGILIDGRADRPRPA